MCSSDGELSSTHASDSEIIEQSDTETVDRWSGIDKIPNIEKFVGNTGSDVL